MFYKKLLPLCCCLLFAPLLTAQDLWSGLQERQQVLPQGRAPVQWPEPLPFVTPVTELRKAGPGEWILSEGWVLRPADRGKDSLRYNATVPGTVLTTLIDRGVYPHPYYGLNNLAIPDSLARRVWWYEIDFTLPDSSQQRYYLLFNGINYRSRIFLNDRFIGETRGAFRRGLFDITPFAKDPSLHLAVQVFPLDHPGIPHEQSMLEGQGLNGGASSLDGPTFIASVGWDWMPGIRDRNTGLWQDVRLLACGPVRAGDPLIVTSLPLPDTSFADIYVEIPLHNGSSKAASGRLALEICSADSARTRPVVAVSLPYALDPGRTDTLVFDPGLLPSLRLRNPRLWWPNGYGEPHLYRMKIRVCEEGDNLPSDCKTLRFGIRELSYELMAMDSLQGPLRLEYRPVQRYVLARKVKTSAEKVKALQDPPFDNLKRVLFCKEKNLYIPALSRPVARGRKTRAQGFRLLPQDDPVGPNLVIRVNGVRIFCRGGDWGMDDALKRSSRERLQPFFELHKELNFNIIRNWTGESTQESFYDLCDEYGMLVWNDFWMTGEDTVEPLDFALFADNAEDAVCRFRTHPCIAVWGPRNEGFAPPRLETMLSRILASRDPTRLYHGQSRFLNMGTSGPWAYFENPAYYFTERADGFNTEMGSFSVPTAATIRKFIAPEDRWPINDVWAYHDLHHTSQNFEGFMRAVEAAGGPGRNDTLPSADTLSVSERLAYADAMMERFADAAQTVCYEAWRAMMEAWNARMWNNTTGLILWMSHPAWPSFIWQTYSYDGHRTGAFYGAKKACEPVHIQLDLAANRAVVVNATRKDLYGMQARARLIAAPGKASPRRTLWVRNHLKIKANSLVPCFEIPLSEAVGSKIVLELYDAAGRRVSDNSYELKF